MLIKIKETGKIEEITLIDPKSGQRWEDDFIFSSISDDDYEELEDDKIMMTQENFDWWSDHCQKFQIADNTLNAKRCEIIANSELGDCSEFNEAYHQYINGYDFNSQPEAMLNFCKSY